MLRSPLKRTRRKVKSAEHRAHHARVAAMPCVACGHHPVEVHHITSDGFKRITRSHARVLPLCSVCHRTGTLAIHVVGHGNFAEYYELDLLAEADRLWANA